MKMEQVSNSPSDSAKNIGSWLVFTDLDGTLLDHDTYSFEPAIGTIRQLQSQQVPIIFNTSKTIIEVLELQKKTDIHQAFVVENGAAICLPEGSPFIDESFARISPGGQHWYSKVFGCSYPDICQYLAQIRQQHHFRFQGFSDMNAEEVQLHTGLDLYQAKLAKQRVASEPLLWHDSDAQLKLFRELLAEHQLELIEGGRFYHIKSNFDKADAMQWLRQAYCTIYHNQFISIALGDSNNDKSMLEQADVAIVIPRKHKPALELDRQHNILAPHPGPHGWAAALQQLINTQALESNHG